MRAPSTSVTPSVRREGTRLKLDVRVSLPDLAYFAQLGEATRDGETLLLPLTYARRPVAAGQAFRSQVLTLDLGKAGTAPKRVVVRATDGREASVRVRR